MQMSNCNMQLAYILEEEVQLRVGVGVLGHFKEWLEDVVQQLLKVLNDPLLLVHIVQPWQLRPGTQLSHLRTYRS